MTKQSLSRGELVLLTLASAAVTANAYYIHPIIARVGEGFGVSASTVGLVPALNQVALAIGIFLLLPLGDRFSNRRLVAIFVFGQFCSLLLMAFAEERIFRDSPNVFICVSTFNTGARDFYQHLGYQVVGPLKDYLVAGYDELLLRKTIAPLATYKTGASTADPQQ